MLRTWLSSLLRADGARILLLPPAHLPALALRPVRGQRWLFPGFGPVAAAFGAAEVEQASGWCVTRARKGWDRAAEKPGGVWRRFWRWLVKREAAQVGLGLVVVMLWDVSCSHSLASGISIQELRSLLHPGKADKQPQRGKKVKIETDLSQSFVS